MSNRYTQLIFPLVSRLDPETAHERTLRALVRAQETRAGRLLLRRIAGETPAQPVELWGLTFPNALGVAAGFDKDVRAPAGLALLGFGHVEVGTLTPWPQPGNPRPRIFRLPEERALINRMGFPNAGMVAATQRLRRLSAGERRFIIGVSVGKQKETRLQDAYADYATVMRSVYRHADYLAINISSPNTPGLRQLQTPYYISRLLGQVAAENHNLSFLHKMPPRPLLVKIAPDLSFGDLDTILQAIADRGLDGVIATNTTLSRDGVADVRSREEGGLSGAPLAERSNELIRYIHRQTEGRLPVIGVGGVFTADDARAKLDAGASLVQVYTGLVYEGPGMAGRILRGLAAGG